MNEKGAILGQPGQYKNPPFLMLPGNPPLEEVTLYDFKINEMPSENPLIVSEKKVKAYTFYCDSVSWDDSAIWEDSKSYTEEKIECVKSVNREGDGSKENPWKNVDYALQILNCIAYNLCCCYIQLKVKGVIDYTVGRLDVSEISQFDGKNIFILSPWDSEKIEIKIIQRGISYRRSGTLCSSCFLINIDVNIDIEVNTPNGLMWYYKHSVYGFFCNNCHLYFCNSVINSKIGEYTYGSKFDTTGYNGNRSIFYHCDCYVKSENTHKYNEGYNLYAVASGFISFTQSTTGTNQFLYCNAKLEAISEEDSICIGFSGNFLAFECNADISCKANKTTDYSASSDSIGYEYIDICYKCHAKINGEATSNGYSAGLEIIAFNYINNVFECTHDLSYYCHAIPDSDGVYLFSEKCCGFYDYENGCHDPCHNIAINGEITEDFCNNE